MTRLSILAASLSAAALAATPALAHAEIESATIADGAMIAAAPNEFAVTFDEPVALAAVTLATVGGGDIALDFSPSAEPAASHVAPLPELDPGDYVLTLRALGDDGHVMVETISFSVDPHAGTPNMDHGMNHGDHGAPAAGEHGEHHDDH